MTRVFTKRGTNHYKLLNANRSTLAIPGDVDEFQLVAFNRDAFDFNSFQCGGLTADQIDRRPTTRIVSSIYGRSRVFSQ